MFGLAAARLSSVSVTSITMAAAGQAPSVATIEAAVASVTRLTDPPRFVLGSKSASRRAILDAATAGVPFDVVVPDIDEKAIGDRARDQPLALVSQIALAKADALLSSVTQDSHPGAVLLTGDQVVTYEGAIREKPASVEEAREFIESYGRAPCGTVGAVCLHDLASGRRVLGVDVAQITYAPMPAEVVDELVADEMTMWCAGGLMVEHPASSAYLQTIEGGVDNVMGLSSRLVASLLAELRAPADAGSVVLRQRSWAVVGDVLNPNKAASRIVARLESQGRPVALVNPRDKSGKCFTSLAAAVQAGAVDAVGAPAPALAQSGPAVCPRKRRPRHPPPPPHPSASACADLVISPALGVGVVEDMWRLGIRYLFVQPGADSERVLQRARELGLVVETGCVLIQEIPPALPAASPKL